MKISVVIPAYNEERLIAQTLSAVRTASEPFHSRGWEAEVIVCDNNSTDRTGEIARANGALVVFEPFNQISRARNTGAAAATGDWLVFVDADSRPSAALFAEVTEQISSGRCVAGGCTVQMDQSYPAADRFVRLWNILSRTFKLMAGSFIFCEATSFREIGGFSLAQFIGEELELSRRLQKLARRKGKQIVILYRHPLLTSARKMHLYSLSEHLRFVLRTLVTFGGTRTRRQDCFTWYDGRR